MASTDTMAVKESFIGHLDGADHPFRKGDLYAADHPAVKKYAKLFEKHELQRVEQATAAPGEKRGSK